MRSPSGRHGFPRSKIYVGDIGENRKKDIISLFQNYGHIYSVYVDENKRFAFVEYRTNDEAREAIRRADGRDLNGARLRVEMAKKESKFGSRMPRRMSPRKVYNPTNASLSSSDTFLNRRLCRSPSMERRPLPPPSFIPPPSKAPLLPPSGSSQSIAPPPAQFAAMMAAAMAAATDPDYQRRLAMAMQSGGPLPAPLPPSRHHRSRSLSHGRSHNRHRYRRNYSPAEAKGTNRPQKMYFDDAVGFDYGRKSSVRRDSDHRFRRNSSPSRPPTRPQPRSYHHNDDVDDRRRRSHRQKRSRRGSKCQHHRRQNERSSSSSSSSPALGDLEFMAAFTAAATGKSTTKLKSVVCEDGGDSRRSTHDRRTNDDRCSKTKDNKESHKSVNN